MNPRLRRAQRAERRKAGGGERRGSEIALAGAMQSSREDLAWAAGLFEGEGCFFIKRSGGLDRTISAKVSLTDEDILQRFCSTVGIGKVEGPYAHGTLKPYWIWRVESFEATQAVMALLWRWMGIRRRAKIVECLQRYHRRSVKKRGSGSGRMRQHYELMREMHAAGVSQNNIAVILECSTALVCRVVAGKRQ